MSTLPDVEAAPLPGVLVIRPRVFEDPRGFFVETFNQRVFAEATGLKVNFVQDNESLSTLGTLRGIHYQLPPSAQGKLVRVIEGAVFDVAVDLRRSSTSLGRWFGLVLSQENHTQLWIPPGFGHGFLTLTEQARFVYKTTAFYDLSTDRSVRWDDEEIGVDWPIDGTDVSISDRDASAPGMSEAELFD